MIEVKYEVVVKDELGNEVIATGEYFSAFEAVEAAVDIEKVAAEGNEIGIRDTDGGNFLSLERFRDFFAAA